jgi:hypothetical protein
MPVATDGNEPVSSLRLTAVAVKQHLLGEKLCGSKSLGKNSTVAIQNIATKITNELNNYRCNSFRFVSPLAPLCDSSKPPSNQFGEPP